MGCCESIDVRREIVFDSLNESTTDDDKEEVGSTDLFQAAYSFLYLENLLFDSSNISRVPICLDEDTFPIVFITFIEKNCFSEISFPFIALSTKLNSRIVAMASNDFLNSKYSHLTAAEAFFKKMLDFLNGNNMQRRALIVADDATNIMERINSTKYFKEIGDFDADFKKFSIIIIATQKEIKKEHVEKLHNFITANGGILVINMNGTENVLLSDFGLSFCAFEAPSNNSKLTVSNSVYKAKENNFSSYVKSLQDLINKDPSFVDFDNATYPIRVCMSECKDENILIKLRDTYSDYMERSDCSESIQLSRFMIKEINKLLPRKYHEKTSQKMNLEEKTITLLTKPNEWTPTGLFLPPYVEGSNFKTSSDCIVQIGTYTNSLSIFDVERFDKGSEMYSYSGGLIFVISKTEEECTITFNKVSTEDFSPFRVFNCNLCTFIISEYTFNNVSRNKETVLSIYNRIGEEISKILPTKPRKKPFVIFSDSNGNEEEDDYPIFFSRELENDIMNPQQVSGSHLLFIRRITRLFIPEMAFDVDTETALCQTIAVIVIKKLYPTFAITENISDLTKCFLKCAQLLSVDVISNALETTLSFRGPPASSSSLLVRNICMASKKNVSPLFDGCIQLPEMLVSMISGLPPVDL